MEEIKEVLDEGEGLDEDQMAEPGEDVPVGVDDQGEGEDDEGGEEEDEVADPEVTPPMLAPPVCRRPAAATLLETTGTAPILLENTEA